MTDTQSYVTQLQKQFLTAMQAAGETQAKLIEAIRAVPTSPEIVTPTPAQFVEQSFGFFTEVLDAQRDMTLRLVKATGVAPAKAAVKQAA
jgi:hypothetical protein